MILSALLAFGTPLAAQDVVLPQASVTLPNPFVEALDGRPLIAIFQNETDSLREELELRDGANVFFNGPISDEVTLEDADIAVLVHPDWATARDFWQEGDLQVMIDALDEVDGTPAARILTPLTAPDGHDILVFSFVETTSDGLSMDPRCMARVVVDEIYNGPEFSTLNMRACSAALAE